MLGVPGFLGLSPCISEHIENLSSDQLRYTSATIEPINAQSYRRDNAVALPFPVRHIPAVIDDNVAGLASSVGADDSLDGQDGADVRLLGLVSVERGILNSLELLGKQNLRRSSRDDLRVGAPNHTRQTSNLRQGNSRLGACTSLQHDAKTSPPCATLVNPHLNHAPLHSPEMACRIAGRRKPSARTESRA